MLPAADPTVALMEAARRPEVMARCYSTAEAAAILSVSTDTVERLVNRGDLRTVLIFSKRRIPLRELVAFVDRQLAPNGRRRAGRVSA